MRPTFGCRGFHYLHWGASQFLVQLHSEEGRGGDFILGGVCTLPGEGGKKSTAHLRALAGGLSTIPKAAVNQLAQHLVTTNTVLGTGEQGSLCISIPRSPRPQGS